MLLAGLVFGLTAAAEPAPRVGSSAPALELPSLSGQTVSLQKLDTGKKTILTFFASWSKSCQAELNDLQALVAESKIKPAVLAVSFDKKTQDLKAFTAKNVYSFPILQDKKLLSIDAFQILILPTTFCLNGNGLIEKIFIDYDDNVKKAIEAWLGS